MIHTKIFIQQKKIEKNSSFNVCHKKFKVIEHKSSKFEKLEQVTDRLCKVTGIFT